VHLNHILRFGRLRLRGPRGGQDDFTLAAIAHNLGRLAKLIPHPPSARPKSLLPNHRARSATSLTVAMTLGHSAGKPERDHADFLQHPWDQAVI
jgi:hypothetical protein